MKFKHILVPVDFSDESRRPFSYLQDLKGKVTLLHVVQDHKVVPPGGTFSPPVSPPQVETELAAATERLDEWAAGLSDTVEVQTEVIAAEDIVDGIQHWAKDHGVELIALSTHGRTGFRRLVLGSVAESILRSATVPVLCFPKE